jgi:DNA-binding CsgD family transcriptional regulator
MERRAWRARGIDGGEERKMDRYPNIGDHGLIGDQQTAAPVTADGVLDWLCCPRSGSPSVFASVLDSERGGHYRIAPARDDYVSRRLYLPDTAILVTQFMTRDGFGEVRDFIPVTGADATDQHRLVRDIRVARGVMRFAIEIQPRFDYGRKPHTLEISDHGVVFAYDGLELTVHGIAPEGSSLAESGITLERVGDGLRWTRSLHEGEIGGVVLESMGGTPRRVSPREAQRMADDTARFWHDRLFEQARAVLAEGSVAAARPGDLDTAVLDESELAMLAMDGGQRQEAIGRLRLQLARVCSAITEVAAARQTLREIEDILTHRAAPGTLTGLVDPFRRTLASTAAREATGRVPLTPAELRLLPYLQTHLTASGIAQRLFLSSHTVKAEIKSIYRKLGVSTRNDAVQKAAAIGLLGA